MNKLVQLWLGNKLPKQHYPKMAHINSVSGAVNVVVKSILLHPIRRKLSKYYLMILRRFTHLTVIGITGSAGKTTTKDMLVSILSQDGKVNASYKNIDPIYNIPATILRCCPDTKYLILEMGVEYPGEMDFYLWIAKPDIGVITNIFPTHTKFFGDENGVFFEKSKLVTSLGKNGFGVLNHRNKFLKKLGENTRSQTVFFGDSTEVSATEKMKLDTNGTSFKLTFDYDPKKSAVINLPIIGFHFVENALAAAAVAKVLEVPLKRIKKGLEVFKPDKHRMNEIKHPSGAVILDDSYNNNPAAAKEAISTLLAYSRHKIKAVVFGDMLELGKLDKKYHEELGRILGKSNISKLICVGNSVKYTVNQFVKTSGRSDAVVFGEYKEAVDTVERLLKKNTVILIKGSRSIGLDKLVDLLCTAEI